MTDSKFRWIIESYGDDNPAVAAALIQHDALSAIAEALAPLEHLEDIAKRLDDLGFGRHAGPGPGGLEGLTLAVSGHPVQSQSLADAVSELSHEVGQAAEAIKSGLADVASSGSQISLSLDDVVGKIEGE